MSHPTTVSTVDELVDAFHESVDAYANASSDRAADRALTWHADTVTELAARDVEIPEGGLFHPEMPHTGWTSR